jgi:phosphoserine aminotransferase
MNPTKVKVYNFNAGPAMLPPPVMEQAQREFLDYMGTGMSIMEMSHRGYHFDEIISGAEKSLRELLSIPENYSVIFYPGGATLKFTSQRGNSRLRFNRSLGKQGRARSKEIRISHEYNLR